MAHYHATVESRSSDTETFGYLATFSNAAEWDPGVLAGEQLDPGPVKTGSRFRLVVPFLGVRISLTYEVIRLVPGREVLLHATNGVLQSTDWIVATDAADGSTVSYDAEVRLRGPLQVLDPVLRPGFRVVAGRAGKTAVPAPFDPVGGAQLLTGAAPLYVRSKLEIGIGEMCSISIEPFRRPPGKIAAPRLSRYLAGQ